MLKTILVPLDGSERADSALAYATALSTLSGARLLLVRTLTVSSTGNVDPHDRSLRAIGTAERYLMDVAAELGERSFACDAVVPIGRTAEAILGEARSRAADLIVLTSHGRTGPGRWVFGSVAEAIVAGSSVPVLVARADQHPRPDLLLAAPRRLLVALDGSAFAEAALAPAAQLATDLDAELDMVRVAERPDDVTVGRDSQVVGYVDEPEDELSGQTQTYLEGVRRHVIECWPELVVRTRVRIGEPTAELSAAAAADRAAMIVMATHGLTGVQRAVLGSVGGRVLEHAAVGSYSCMNKQAPLPAASRPGRKSRAWRHRETTGRPTHASDSGPRWDDPALRGWHVRPGAPGVAAHHAVWNRAQGRLRWPP
jgi:nucleotide-binding universal stress UspA family protein